MLCFERIAVKVAAEALPKRKWDTRFVFASPWKAEIFVPRLCVWYLYASQDGEVEDAVWE